MKTHRKSNNGNSGMALLTTLLLLVLLSSLLAGFFVLVTTGQQLTGGAKQETRAFYGAEAGLEKMTADLGTLFDATYAPTAAELNTITQNPPPTLGDLTFTAADGTSGYTITYPQDAFGKPIATNAQIKSGPYYGMTGLITPYTLTATARTASGAEVELRRTTQTVGIPAFEFGVFCDMECGFHAGPNFNFGGRIHSNRNLYLAEGSGSTLTLPDRVTAYGEVVRDVLMNGQALSAGGWTGTVNVTTSPGTSSVRALGASEGSVNDLPGTTPLRVPPTPYKPPANESGSWSSISKTTYNSTILNGATGAKKLKLPIEILTKNSLVPGKPIDIIRRPLKGDDPVLEGERYFAQASMKILLSDNLNDIMQLPCVDQKSVPVDLSTLAWDASMPASYPASDPNAGNHFKGWYSTGNPNPVPIATSAAGLARVGGATGTVPAIGYSLVGSNGYWVPKWDPIITGYLLIEIQKGYNPPCGSWQDVTQEILKLGIAGRNLNPGLAINGATQFPNEPPLPGAQIAPSTCPDPSPNAVIRLERVRDNPSNYAANGNCGVNLSKVPPIPTNSQDYWPNVLFDTREGLLRDVTPAGGNVTAGGIINYVELDANNLGRWLTGQIGTKGPGAFDPQNQPYDYVVYFSDRRGNYVPTGGLTSVWPPVSPSGNETGEYGFNDFVNSNVANGCPDGKAEQPGEDLAENGVLYTYGMKPTPSVTNGMFGDALLSATTPSSCVVAGVWPGSYVRNAQDARMNPPLFFRRALKVVNGSNLKLPLSAVPCPGSTVCGLTIASENPVYVQGDYNANSAGGGFNDAHVGSAILADSVTLVSNKYNDVNTFSSPYNLGQRNAATSWYRLAILAGKGPGFLWIPGTASDFGSDGGMHNFIRYIENWGGQTLNYRGSIVSLFYNRQAVGTYKCCNTVYSPPTRAYNFDTDFLDPSLLPPRTPLFRDVNTTGFAQILYSDQK